MRKSKISEVKDQILNLFENLKVRIFTSKELEAIISKNKATWNLARSTSVGSIIQLLTDEGKLKHYEFDFPSRKYVRYTWGIVPDYEVLISIRPDVYFTHYTAMYFHELTEQIPSNIYLNFEQPAKNIEKGSLNQNSIDYAFRNAPRTTNNICSFGDKKIYLLNGMFTGKLGVINFPLQDNEMIYVTDIERTLIDITVRPMYSGGVFEVLKAYRLAKDKVSVNKLAATLKKLNYIYPYHQSIGLYLEKSGVYKESSIRLFKNFEMNYDFYLTYQMKEKDYSKDWRLYFPKGF